MALPLPADPLDPYDPGRPGDTGPDPVDPPDPPDLGYPGSSTPVNPGSPAANFVGFGKLNIDEGGLLADANGLHAVAGHLIFQERIPGPPIKTTLGYGLGDKEWDGVVRVTYAGADLAEVDLADDETEGYHFHPGTVSTGTSDPVQGEDTYTPDTGKVYDQIPNVFIRVPSYFAIETSPEKFVGIFRTRKLWKYTDAGVPISQDYSANVADRAVDVIRQYYERYISDPSAALARFQARVNWPSYAALYNNAAGSLSWNNGTETLSINRFECHTVFTGALPLARALDAICQVACARWQDDGKQIVFRLATDQTVSHTFRWHNIVDGSIKRSMRKLANAPRHYKINFRNIYDPLLAPTSEKQIKRQALIDRHGERLTEIELPNMSHSQAQRIGEYQLRMEVDNPHLVQLAAPADSLKLLPGDYAQIDLQDTRIDGKYLVLKPKLKSPERTPDETEFLLQKIAGTLYSDSDHRPIEAET